MTDTQTPLLEIRELTKRYRRSAGIAFWEKAEFTAVNNASLTVFRGECLALVGESGSGKSTIGRCLTRLVVPESGQVIFDGKDLLRLSERQFRSYRQHIQMIFQNPLQALNPRQTVSSCLAEPLKVFRRLKHDALKKEIGRLLSQVGLTQDLAERYPAELSGGQRQRVAIARALALQPQFLIADEPTSSLDAAYRFQIIELLANLMKNMQLTLLLITHDLGIVSAIADRIAVMYRGTIVETAPRAELLTTPKHPYTKLLLQASPHLQPASDPAPVTAELPAAAPVPCSNACAYLAQCPVRDRGCYEQPVAVAQVSEQHRVMCSRIESGVVQLGNPAPLKQRQTARGRC